MHRAEYAGNCYISTLFLSTLSLCLTLLYPCTSQVGVTATKPSSAVEEGEKDGGHAGRELCPFEQGIVSFSCLTLACWRSACCTQDRVATTGARATQVYLKQEDTERG